MWHHTTHLGAWWPVLILFVLVIIAFELWMIIDAALNKKLSDKAKAWWIIGMLLIHPFVAIVYFFTGRKQS